MKMKNRLVVLFSLMVIVSTALASCATPTPQVVVQTQVVQQTVVVPQVQTQVVQQTVVVPQVQTQVVQVTAPPAAQPAAKPYDGVQLSLASMTDQYVQTFRYLLPRFAQQTGIVVTMDELGYVDLRQKVVADFVAHTAQYDLITTDIVWSGEFAANKNTVDLTDLIAKDKAEIKPDDILPVMWTEGEY